MCLGVHDALNLRDQIYATKTVLAEDTESDASWYLDVACGAEFEAEVGAMVQIIGIDSDARGCTSCLSSVSKIPFRKIRFPTQFRYIGLP
jgi:hypothetical protein